MRIKPSFCNILYCPAVVKPTTLNRNTLLVTQTDAFQQLAILQSHNSPCDCAVSRLFTLFLTVSLMLFNTPTFNGNTRLVTVTVTDTFKRYKNERLTQSQFGTEKSCCVLPRKIRKTLFTLNIWNAINTNMSQKHVPFVSARTKIEKCF